MRCFLLAVISLFVASAALAQSPLAKPVPAFDQHLIEQQQQFLRDALNKNEAALELAVADDFQGIEANGDFYDKGELVENVEAMAKETRAYDFRVAKLNDAAAVVAYNLIVPGERLRYRHMADTWAKVGGRWQLKFRQVTPNVWSANDLD
jgi:hypothetical protein